MLHSCLILGDSIALGLSTVIKGCSVIAKVGMSSAWILANAHAGNFDIVYMSSGSNDPYNPQLYNNVLATKQKFSKSKIVCILPVNATAKAAVTHACSGTKIVSFIPSKDGIHPRSYSELAAAVK